MSAGLLTFRLANSADAAVMGSFMARNFLAAYGHCSTPDNVARAVDVHYGVPAQQRQIADPLRLNLLAFRDEALAGVAQLRFDSPCPVAVGEPAPIELSRFYVDTSLHGTGVAAAMMQDLRTRARGRGAVRLWLSVWKQSGQAKRFYEKQGFGIVGSTHFMVGDDPMHDWVMLGAA